MKPAKQTNLGWDYHWYLEVLPELCVIIDWNVKQIVGGWEQDQENI